MKLLVTGVTGKVGQTFLPAFLSDPKFTDTRVVALCNNRSVPAGDRVEVQHGSISDPAAVARAMQGVTHVLHMAAVKESPDLAIDVSIKGLFVLLESFRNLPRPGRFVLIGGDCSVGHIFHDYQNPITEDAPRRAYKGCYALTKVLEEVMLEQYGIDHCCLRAPWIMEKDDFRFVLAFGPDQFGGPVWSDLIDERSLRRYAAGGHVPLMLDHAGRALRRSFVHVDDLVSAILAALTHPAAQGETFHICMDQPVDYGVVAEQAQRKYGLKPVEIPTPFFGNWLCNAKARQRLDWAPDIGPETLMDRAFDYRRDKGESRKIWYPG